MELNGNFARLFWWPLFLFYQYRRTIIWFSNVINLTRQASLANRISTITFLSIIRGLFRATKFSFDLRLVVTTTNASFNEYHSGSLRFNVKRCHNASIAPIRSSTLFTPRILLRTCRNFSSRSRNNRETSFKQRNRNTSFLFGRPTIRMNLQGANYQIRFRKCKCKERINFRFLYIGLIPFRRSLFRTMRNSNTMRDATIGVSMASFANRVLNRNALSTEKRAISNCNSFFRVVWVWNVAISAGH